MSIWLALENLNQGWLENRLAPHALARFDPAVFNTQKLQNEYQN